MGARWTNALRHTMQRAIVSSSYSSIGAPQVGQLFASRSGVDEALRRAAAAPRVAACLALKPPPPAEGPGPGPEPVTAAAPDSCAPLGASAGGDISLVGEETAVEIEEEDVPEGFTDGCGAK